MKRLKQFTRIAEPTRPTWPQPTTVSVALGSITTPPPKGMPVNSRVGEEKQSGEIAYCLGKKTRWDGLNTDETNKVIRQEKINRLQRNPFLCVGARTQVWGMPLNTYPDYQCVLKRCMYAMQHFYRYSLKPTIRLMCHSTSFTYRTWNIFKHRNFHSPVNEDCWHS